MNKDRALEFYEQISLTNYQAEKERQKTNRFIALLIAITLISVFFIHSFFVVPVEEEHYSVDNGGQIVSASTIVGDNTNGLQDKKN